MNKNTLSVFACLLAFAGTACAAPDTDTCIKAMQDEMARGLSRLKMDAFAKPYFISYALRMQDDWTIRATLGSIIEETPYSTAIVVPVLRVGSRSFDNTNYYGSVGNYPHYAYGPLDCDYDALRFAIWQMTDSSYTEAVEKLDQKRAFLEKRSITGAQDDFSPAPQVNILNPLEPQKPDYARLREIAVKASLVFKGRPELFDSEVSVGAYNDSRRYVNSEGALYRGRDSSASVFMRAEVQLADGLKTSVRRHFNYSAFANIPSVEFFTEQAQQMAREGAALASSKIAEPYIGPVLFEGDAAGEFFHELLANNLMRPRMWWTETDRDRETGLFYNKLGMRVAAPIVNATDDPALDSYAGQSLFGGYKADDEGVPPQKVSVIKNGKLNDLLMSRAPVAERKTSNGHGRGFYYYPQGMPGNLIVTVSSTIAQAELKNSLRAMCKSLDLEYGIIIRNEGDLHGTFDAYKLYTADGREEPVHGAQFAELGLRALRDIVLASDRTGVYTYTFKEVPYSLAAPSVIIQEGELKKTETRPEKLPYLKNPVAETR